MSNTPLMDEALKSGISTGAEAESQVKETAKPAESVPAKAEVSVEKTQAETPANTSPTVTEDNLPFHKHPKFTEALKNAKEAQRQYAELQKQFQEQKAFLDGLRQGTPKQEAGIPDEQLQAAEQLMEILSKSPRFKERFGLSELENLKKQNQEYAQARAQEVFDKEMGEILTYAESVGLDKTEVDENLREIMASHPVYSEKDYKQGLIRTVFRDAYWEKMGVLKEAEINKKLIQEQEAKRRANSETTTRDGSSKPASKKFASMEQFLENQIKEAGGLTV